MSTKSTRSSISDHAPNSGNLMQRQPRFSRFQAIMAVACAILLIAGIIASWQTLRQRMSQSSSVPSAEETASLYDTTMDDNYYRLDPTTHKVLWHRSFPSIPSIGNTPGLLPMVAKNGLLYILTTENDSSVFYALNPADGSTRWSTPALTKADFNTLSVGPNPPLITNDMVYFSVVSMSQGYSVVHALDAITGKEVWQYRLDGTGINGMNVPNGDASAGITLQAATSDVLYATTYTGPYDHPVTTLYALDIKHQGQILWQHTIITTGLPDFGGTVINGVLCLSSTQQNADTKTIYGYDASTGTQKWSVPVSGRVDHLVDANGVLYAGTGRFKMTQSHQLYTDKGDVYALRPEDGTTLWHYVTEGGASDPVIKSGEVYFTSSLNNGDEHTPLTLTALDAATGQLRWSQIVPDSGNVNPRPVASDNFLYLSLFNGKGTVGVFHIQDGKPAGSFSVPTTLFGGSFFLTIAP